jgi:hypothetical protein
MWHPEVLPVDWAAVAVTLEELGLLQDACLAGDTGLALRLGHRASAGLDMLVPAPFSGADWQERLTGVPNLRDVAVGPNILRADVRGIKVSVVHDTTPLLFPTDPLGSLQVADVRDIACMKIAAIAAGGIRLDFVDLHAATAQVDLGTLLDLFFRKYADTRYSRADILRALTHFAGAEAEPMPEMRLPTTWSDVRGYFERTIPTLARPE